MWDSGKDKDYGLVDEEGLPLPRGSIKFKEQS
jgi:hypothetical protein